MVNQIELIKKQIKSNIQLLIEDNKLEKAIRLIDEYMNLSQDDMEAYSIKAVILIIQGLVYEAEITLKNGLQNENDNFDLLFNLGYVYEITNRYIEAIRLYKMAKENCNDNDLINEIDGAILRITQSNKELLNNVTIVPKYNILIYTSNFSDDNINKVRTIFNVLGFINNKFIADKDVHVIDKENIKSLNIDYIIVIEKNKDKAKHVKRELSEYILTDKIYDYYEYKYPLCVEGFEYKFDELLKKSSVELLVTGLSYAETAIDCNSIGMSAFNFALSSQDLFYDYSILKYLLNFQHIKNNLKYCIIGLAYYSFDYDLSKTSESTRIHRYLPMLHMAPNYLNIPQLSIIHYDYLNTNFKNDYLSISNAKRNTVMYSDNKEVQEYIARHHSEMNHPDTVTVNKKVFRDYLELLKIHNIKPIVVISPTSKQHYQYFENSTLKDRFYSILNEFEREYKFQILDYFDSNLFVDSDFWDYSHMNKNGADKFTQMLRKEIIW